jgi:hypothetical protein
MKHIFFGFALTLVFSCNSCKEKEDCSKYVYIQSNTNEAKVVWLSLSYPDTTYVCLNQKNGLAPFEKIEISFGQPSKSCWDTELQKNLLQIFVLDAMVYQDSTCDAISTNPQLYQRMEFTLEQMRNQNWVVNVDE